MEVLDRTVSPARSWRWLPRALVAVRTIRSRFSPPARTGVLAARALPFCTSLAADATITDVEVSDVAVGAAGEPAPAAAVLAVREGA
jgi:hypothetical protein